MFVPGKPFQLTLMFVGKAVAYFQGLYNKSSLLYLSANIILGLKGLPGTNTLAYYENL